VTYTARCGLRRRARQCQRDTESGMWCHRTDASTLVLGKLN